MGCLYRLKFPNGKSYVGITTHSAQKRFAKHCEMAVAAHSSALARAIRKYTPAAVEVKSLADLDDWELLCLAEQEAIDLFRTHTTRNGYNMTSGGDGVVDPDDEVRAKMSESSRRTWSSEELRAWRSAESKRQWADPAAREANAALTKERCKDPEYLKKMSEAGKQSWEGDKRKTQLAGRARRSMLHYAAIQVRLAYAECLGEKRACSLIG